MKCFLKFVLIVLLQLPFALDISGQIWLSDKDIYDAAEEYLDGKEYIEALPLYFLLEKKEVINANIDYKIGTCYLNLRGHKEESIPYLENASKDITFDYNNSIDETQAPVKAILLLGIAYRINNQPKKAIEIFESLRDTLSSRDAEMDAIIDMHISRCNNAILLAAFPGEPHTEKLPPQINDEFSNYNPVLVDHDRVLYYMEELKFYDALMRVEMEKDEWGMPENLTPKIGSDGDHILVGASSDGKSLLLYIYDPLKAGEIYTTSLNDDGWTKLEALNENINTKYHETHASFSPDSKTLYFTSNRPDGYGALDIYMSKLDENGEWGPAHNLGPAINTPFNEENPIINVEDEILYFSSQGHLNMGGYDIFRSQRKGENEWRQAINLGSPVCTTDDDLFYFPLESGMSGLMSRLEDPGTTLYDIYRYNSMTFANSPRFTIKGNSQNVDSSNYRDYELLVINNETSDTLIKTNPEPDGNYELLLPAGDFAIVLVDDEGRKSDSTIKFEDEEIDKDLVIVPVVKPVEERDTLRLENLLFAFDSYSILKENKVLLDEIKSKMVKYDSLIFKVVGYTDALGSENYNLRLSKLRAQAIANYLISESVDKNRIKVVARGETNPIALNTKADGSDNPAGRKYNRRVELVPETRIPGLIIIYNTNIPENLLQK